MTTPRRDLLLARSIWSRRSPTSHVVQRRETRRVAKDIKVHRIRLERPFWSMRKMVTKGVITIVKSMVSIVSRPVRQFTIVRRKSRSRGSQNISSLRSRAEPISRTARRYGSSRLRPIAFRSNVSIRHPIATARVVKHLRNITALKTRSYWKTTARNVSLRT